MLCYEYSKHTIYCTAGLQSTFTFVCCWTTNCTGLFCKNCEKISHTYWWYRVPQKILLSTSVSQKRCHYILVSNFARADQFSTSFTAKHSSKFVMQRSIKVPRPHLWHVATLPCEISVTFYLVVASFPNFCSATLLLQVLLYMTQCTEF